MSVALILLCVLFGLINQTTQSSSSDSSSSVSNPNYYGKWVSGPTPSDPAIVEWVRGRRVPMSSWTGIDHAALEFDIRAGPDGATYTYTVELIGPAGVQKRWGRYLEGSTIYDAKPVQLSLTQLESKLEARRKYNLFTYNCYDYAWEVYSKF